MTNSERHEQVLGFLGISDGLARVQEAGSQGDRSRLASEISAVFELIANYAPALSVAEAAEYLGVSEPTVRDWARRGLLERAGDSRPYRISLSSVTALSARLKTLRSVAQDERRWGPLLRDAADQRVLSLPEVREGIDEAREMIARRRRG